LLILVRKLQLKHQLLKAIMLLMIHLRTPLKFNLMLQWRPNQKLFNLRQFNHLKSKPRQKRIRKVGSHLTIMMMQLMPSWLMLQQRLEPFTEETREEKELTT